MSSKKTHTLSGCSLGLLLFITALRLKILEMMSCELTVVCVDITFFQPSNGQTVCKKSYLFTFNTGKRLSLALFTMSMDRFH